MAAVPLFINTNMVAVTSRENTLLGTLAMTTTTPWKATLENIKPRSCDYFAIIPSLFYNVGV